MPKFTIESTYRLPVYRHRTYEAATIEEACRMAMEDDDWEGQKEDPETAGPTYLTGAWEGEDSAYSRPTVEIPADMAAEDALRDADRELLAAVKDALPADPSRHGGVFFGLTGDRVHKIEIRVEAYERLLAAIAKVEGR